jgi:hypothetical protein
VGGFIASLVTQEKKASTQLEAASVGVGTVGGYGVGSHHHLVTRKYVTLKDQRKIEDLKHRAWYEAKEGKPYTVGDYLAVATYAHTDYVIVELSNAQYLVKPTDSGGLGRRTVPDLYLELYSGARYKIWHFLEDVSRAKCSVGAGAAPSPPVFTLPSSKDSKRGRARRRHRKTDYESVDSDGHSTSRSASRSSSRKSGSWSRSYATRKDE